VALYAGLTMVTNVPFYSFKDVQHEEERALCGDCSDRSGHRCHQHRSANSVFGIFVIYGVSGYVIYGCAQSQGATDQCDQHLYGRA